MSKSAPLQQDIIDAVFRPVIAFFIGMVLGYTVQLAGDTGWPVALAYTAILAVLAIVGLWIYERLHRFSDWVFEKTGLGAGLKPQLVRPPAKRKHWFVRFGWVAGLAAGGLAVFFLPEEMLAWL